MKKPVEDLAYDHELVEMGRAERGSVDEIWWSKQKALIPMQSGSCGWGGKGAFFLRNVSFSHMKKYKMDTYTLAKSGVGEKGDTHYSKKK